MLIRSVTIQKLINTVKLPVKMSNNFNAGPLLRQQGSSNEVCINPLLQNYSTCDSKVYFVSAPSYKMFVILFSNNIIFLFSISCSDL